MPRKETNTTQGKEEEERTATSLPPNKKIEKKKNERTTSKIKGNAKLIFFNLVTYFNQKDLTLEQLNALKNKKKSSVRLYLNKCTNPCLQQARKLLGLGGRVTKKDEAIEALVKTLCKKIEEGIIITRYLFSNIVKKVLQVLFKRIKSQRIILKNRK